MSLNHFYAMQASQNTMKNFIGAREWGKRLNPYWVYSAHTFSPHVGSLCSPTWGFQKHNCYAVTLQAHISPVILPHFQKYICYAVATWKIPHRTTQHPLSSIGMKELCSWKPYMCKAYYRFLYSQLGTSCVSESLIFVVHVSFSIFATRYELCFWKPHVGERSEPTWGLNGHMKWTRNGFSFFQIKGVITH